MTAQRSMGKTSQITCKANSRGCDEEGKDPDTTEKQSLERENSEREWNRMNLVIKGT